MKTQTQKTAIATKNSGKISEENKSKFNKNNAMKKNVLFTLSLILIGTLSLFGQTQLIQNGNFSNLNSSWQRSGFWYISDQYGCYHSASGYAFVGTSSGGGANSAWGNLYQQVTIPANATSATLSYWISINTDEVTTSIDYDYISVYLTDLSWNPVTSETAHIYGNLMGASGSGNCQSYSQHSFSIPSNLFGQTLLVVFHTYTDGAKLTKFRVDDVSLTATVQTCNAVSITNQLQNQTICQGSSATLSVSCSGTSPITYQWYKNASAISGATNSSYSANSAGSYYCIATNCSGNEQDMSNTVTVTTGSTPTTPAVTPSGTQSVCNGNQVTFSVVNPNSNYTYTWIPGNNTGTSFSTGTPGSYTVQASNSCGTSPNSNTVTVVAGNTATPPVIYAQNNVTSFCLGTGSVALCVQNPVSGTTYTWFPGSQTGTSIVVNNAGNYTCTATNSCGTSDVSNAIAITVNQAPITTFAYNGTQCNYYFSDNSTGNPMSWNWNFDDPISGNNTSILQNPQHVFSNDGLYNVTLTSTNLCGSNSFVQNVYVTGCNVGIADIIGPTGFNFSVDPNPVNEYADINFTITENTEISVTLFDIIGGQKMELAQGFFPAGKHSIKFFAADKILDGIYFIKLNAGTKSITRKIIVN